MVAFAIAPAAASAGFGEGFPDLRVAMSGDTGPVPKGQNATYATEVTNQGTGPAEGEDAVVSLNTFRVNGDRPVANPYVSAAPSQGACTPENFESRFGTYYGQRCQLGTIPAGGSVIVNSVVQVNESMDHQSYVGSYEDGLAQVTTLVDSPPSVSGAKEIKIGGLPPGCAGDDFTVKLKAKGAKKLTATLRGPVQADGKPFSDAFPKTKKVANQKGGKAKVPIDPAALEPGYHELKVAAKYEDRPKRKASAIFQACP